MCCWSWVIYSPRKTWIILDSFIVYGVSISSTCLICLSLPVLHTAGLCWPQHGGVCRFRLHRALLYPGGLRHQEHSAGQLHSEGAYENPMKKAKLVQLRCLRLNEGHFYIHVYFNFKLYVEISMTTILLHNHCTLFACTVTDCGKCVTQSTRSQLNLNSYAIIEPDSLSG